MRKFLVLALAAAALAWSTPAKAAEPILFDPDGAGSMGGFAMFTLDWSPGNSLLVESRAYDPANPLVPGLATVYFQANLATAYLTSGSPLFTNGDGGNYFTVVAGFGVQFAQGIDPLFGGLTTTFALDLSNTTNFFNIYRNSAPASDLTGVCFVCGTPVNPILTAEAFDASAGGFNSTFSVPNFAPSILGGPAQTPVNLDNFGADDWPLVDTLVGSGATNIKVRVTGFNAAYFPTLSVGTTFVQTNTSQVNPYDQTDPSACFDSNGLFDGGGADCDIAGAGSVGAVNGRTGRIITQSDANSSFIAPEIVPEPTTLSLLGLGLLVGGAHLRRRAKKNG